MKTPRETLMFEHAAERNRLDRIRQESLASHFEPAPGLLALFWIELVWPLRRTLAACAFIWLLILLLNSSGERAPLTSTTAQRFPTSPQLIKQLQAQNQLRQELLTGENPEPTAPRGPQSQAPVLNPQPLSLNHECYLA